jgi:hypothetical protein
MHIEIKSVKIFALVFLALLNYSVKGQEVDTIAVKPFEQYWTKPRLIPKIGGGAQDNAFVEAGIQWQKIYVHTLSLASTGAYFTVDGLFKKDGNTIIGPKIGYEVTAGLIGIAADVTYYTDFSHKTIMFTPKAGLSVLGFANLFYGRNFNLSDNPFTSISKNRFSLVFNINKDYFNLKEAPKRHPRK